MASIVIVVLWVRTNFGLGVVERSTESLDSTLISLLVSQIPVTIASSQTNLLPS
jgi:hypothetical protein